MLFIIDLIKYNVKFVCFTILNCPSFNLYQPFKASLLQLGSYLNRFMHGSNYSRRLRRKDVDRPMDALILACTGFPSTLRGNSCPPEPDSDTVAK